MKELKGKVEYEGTGDERRSLEKSWSNRIGKVGVFRNWRGTEEFAETEEVWRSWRRRIGMRDWRKTKKSGWRHSWENYEYIRSRGGGQEYLRDAG